MKSLQKVSGRCLSFFRYVFHARWASRHDLERFQIVVNQSRDAMLQISRDFRVLQVNPASREILGLQLGQTQSAFLKSILAFDPVLDQKLLLQLCQNGAISEHHCVRCDGLEFDIELSVSQLPGLEPATFSLMLHNITDRKKSEALLIERNEALRISEERYMLAANGSNDGLWDWNLTSGEIYYSARWKSMLGFHENELKPVPGEWFDRVHPDDLVQLRSQLSKHLSHHVEHFECEYRMAPKMGPYRWMLARGLAVWNPNGYAYRIAGSQTDITERKNLEEQLRYEALHDGLTGMANRVMLLDHLNRANNRKKRKPDWQFAVFFLDLDRFKQINDSLGHQAGDQLLIETAQRLEIGLRSVDVMTCFSGPETLARIAGDEFVILLENFHSIEAVQTVAERITRLLGAPFNVAERKVSLSTSVGVVVPEQPYDHVEDIIRDADIAMYQAKQLGSGQIVHFQPAIYAVATS
jgi:diguanylate cyclase (GGDEF)-like protein/PAS domain S-box-containing protein